MVCEHCYGKGERGSVAWHGTKVCPECQGSGIVSCCDTAGAYDQDSAEVKRLAEQYGRKVVGEIKPMKIVDGRRAWECMMDDGKREITVELREAT